MTAHGERRRLPAAALFGVALMSGIVAWGVIEHHARMAPGIGGRVAMPAPPGAAAQYADVCRLAGRCDAGFGAIRWFRVDADTLPADVCPGESGALVGCYERETRSLTLAAPHLQSDTLLRHELMHAALGGGGQAWGHNCQFFASRHATWWAKSPCG